MKKDNEIITEETKELVARRSPPGDRWFALSRKDVIFDSLTEVLEFIYQETGQTKFYMDARGGEVHIVSEEEKVIEPEPPKKYSLYGEY